MKTLNRWPLCSLGPVLILSGCGVGSVEPAPPRRGDGDAGPVTTLDGSTPLDAPEEAPGHASSETCGNGRDDDADGIADNGCVCTPGGSQSCFLGRAAFAGVGQCVLGVQHCALNEEFPRWGPCTGYGQPSADMCDGVDNDCDASTADGSADPRVGQTCDGNDADVCMAGRMQCVVASIQCVEEAGARIELCDGVNNDCDLTTPDGAAEPTLGQPCDGSDADMCTEGILRCALGTLSCDDLSSSDEERCDGADNDCDMRVDEDLVVVEDLFVYGETTVSRPVDIVWAVDQSSSMREEIASVRSNINGYAAELSAGGSDFFLQMIASPYGTMGICIDPPLGGPGCTDASRYHQVPVVVASTDALTIIQARIDELEARMRHDSLRVFVVVTDDNSELSADAFHSWIRTRPGYGDYLFYAVVGRFSCPGTSQRGTVYEELAAWTGGHIEDVCTSDWAASFGRFAADIIQRTLVYPLSERPCHDAIHVFFGGIEQPVGSVWHYDRGSNAVVIEEASVPAVGTPIVVRYERG